MLERDGIHRSWPGSGQSKLLLKPRPSVWQWRASEDKGKSALASWTGQKRCKRTEEGFGASEASNVLCEVVTISKLEKHRGFDYPTLGAQGCRLTQLRNRIEAAAVVPSEKPAAKSTVSAWCLESSSHVHMLLPRMVAP